MNTMSVAPSKVSGLAPKLNGAGKGDVLARLKISVPKKPNKKERELLEQLQKVQKVR